MVAWDGNVASASECVNAGEGGSEGVGGEVGRKDSKVRVQAKMALDGRWFGVVGAAEW